MQQQQQQGQGFQLIREPYRATEEQFRLFVSGLDAVLNQWTALHLVAQHCDALALQSMYQELITWFQTDGEVYSDDLEIFFENFFAEARSVVLEDDSMKEVGDLLHNMYCRCCQNDYSLVEQYVASLAVYQQVNPVRLSVNAGDDGTSGGAVEAEAVQLHQTANEEEEGNDELDVPMVTEQQKPRNKKNKKNTYERDNDGWCVVRR
ncbi:pre-rRNA-processing protein TSR2 [Trypanosoma grayi]|uniref:pre-rRNA-processing protein TSR2 n=1 Tax=Trypanosoma grayi TaxID=71804 RepID=UPI0004F3EFC0|nr:pre-rRNA-processing protein TSR2 [Trypanosoma grayi]KEG11603.1 pre-rRNA-processing protein TSR2 [Trypanosoma grayi]